MDAQTRKEPSTQAQEMALVQVEVNACSSESGRMLGGIETRGGAIMKEQCEELCQMQVDIMEKLQAKCQQLARMSELQDQADQASIAEEWVACGKENARVAWWRWIERVMEQIGEGVGRILE